MRQGNLDRKSRGLSHNKGNKITTQVNVPLSSQGDDGDQIMVGSTLYTKSQGNWMAFESTSIDKGKIGEWIPLRFLNNWMNYDTSQYMQAGYLLDELGWVHLRGVIKNYKADDIHNTNESICELPPLYSPHKKIYCNVLYDGNNSRRMLIYSSGVIALIGFDELAALASKWTALDNISWWVGKERLRQL
jgi:hypothetical protein